jgi:hypothetical protein
VPLALALAPPAEEPPAARCFSISTFQPPTRSLAACDRALSE